RGFSSRMVRGFDTSAVTRRIHHTFRDAETIRFAGPALGAKPGTSLAPATTLVIVEPSGASKPGSGVRVPFCSKKTCTSAGEGEAICNSIGIVAPAKSPGLTMVIDGPGRNPAATYTPRATRTRTTTATRSLRTLASYQK